MSLNVEELRRIAALARLRLSATEEAAFASQLSEVVDYIDQLRQFDDGALHSDGEPAPAPEPDAPADETNDVPAAGPPLLGGFLDNAPASLDRFLLVPQVKAAPGGGASGSEAGRR